MQFSKSFFTNGTNEFSFFFMNSLYIYFQIKPFNKIFATVNTIEFFIFSWTAVICDFKSIFYNYIQCIKYFILYHICAALTCTILLISFLQISQLNFVICRDLATFILSLSWTFWICFFNLPPSEKKYLNIYICDLFWLHELCECVSLKFLLLKMNYHKIHIWDLCDLHEFQGCVSFLSLVSSSLSFILNHWIFLISITYQYSVSNFNSTDNWKFCEWFWLIFSDY